MPTPMLHLAVARQVAPHVGDLAESPEYYLGCLSPDAIHARGNAVTRAHKNVTHLINPDLRDSIPMQERLDEMYRNGLALTQSARGAQDALLCGYGIHLLTDAVWTLTAYAEFKSICDAEGRRTDVYYNDLDQCEYALHRDTPWLHGAFDLLYEAVPRDIPNIVVDAGGVAHTTEGVLLTAEELRWWCDHVRDWFAQYDAARYAPNHYITSERVERFIVEASAQIVRDLGIPHA